MRLLSALLALALPALSDDVLLQESRAWRGTIEARAAGREPGDGSGREEQIERIEFLLVSEPPKLRGADRRVLLRMREATGSYLLRVDRREGEGELAVATQGEGAGRLYPDVGGAVDLSEDTYALRFEVSPTTLVARTTLSGVDGGRFTTFRTVLDRRPFLHGFEVDGVPEEGRTLLRGVRTFEDRRARFVRDVTITWTIRRVDPVVTGRVVDHLGRPVPGMRVLARTTDPQRVRAGLPPLLRTGDTDGTGRFAIPAFWGFWRVAVVGCSRDGILYAGRQVEGGVELRFEEVGTLDVTVAAYRHAALPEPDLLARRFRDDVDAYLGHVLPRAREEVVRYALVSPPGER